MADGARITRVDSIKILESLGDPEFYLACPLFFFMRSQGLLAWSKWKPVLDGGGCSGCNSDYVQRVLAAFCKALHEAAEVDNRLLTPLARYMCQRFGWKTDGLRLIYKHQGKDAEIVFYPEVRDESPNQADKVRAGA